MQTSSPYKYDFTCEHATRMDCWNTHEENHGEIKKVTEETTIQERKAREMNKDGKKDLNTKTESREKKIKSLKALLRKHEKAIDKLKHATKQSQISVATTSADQCKGKNSRDNHSSVTKECSKQRLNGVRGRRRRKKLECCNSAASTRDVDIWMSRGDLITKDEFLAVVGLVRVAKFH